MANCYFFWHDYKPVSVYNFNDISSGTGPHAVPSADVLYQCSKCNKLKTVTVNYVENLTIKDLQHE